MVLTFDIIYVILLIATIIVVMYFAYTLYAMWSAAPFVPMSKQTVENMLQILALTKDDIVIDLGSGDGRAVFAAAKQANAATGVEINPVLLYWSRFFQLVRKQKNVFFVRENLWAFDTSKATVIILFFIPGKMEALAHKLQSELKPGTRIASYGFRFPNWQPETEYDKIRLYRTSS